jgi:hypothetical protein
MLLYCKLDVSQLMRDDADDVEVFSTFFAITNGSLCWQELSFDRFAQLPVA